MPRRRVLTIALAALGAFGVRRGGRAVAAPPELRVPGGATTETFDFETCGIEGWTTVAGHWAIEEMAGAPSGKKVLVQRAKNGQFNVIVAPSAYADVDVSMKFKPILGRQDASGVRLYTYDRGRRQLATVSVKRPALGQWHTVRVVAVGDRSQAWLDGAAFDDLTIRGTKGA